jgi:DNA-binding XRE family transcriptional regulator
VLHVYTSVCPVDSLLRPRQDLNVSNLSVTVGRAFGRKLSEARTRAELSQEALGYLSGIHRTQISRLEAGDSVPKLDTVIQLAGALGIATAELLPAILWEPPTPRPATGGFRQA